jgi:outer membrane protein
MKIFLRAFVPAVLLLTFLSGPALAQTKIATVDLQKLMENYWKSKQALAALHDRSSQLDKDDKSMKDDYQKAADEYQQLLTKANDPVISAEERTRRKQDAAAKQKQLEDRRAAIAQYESQAQAQLNDQLQHMSEKVRTEIQDHVNAAAKAGGYTLVLNTADSVITVGAGRITVPSPVAYGVSEIDLTDSILKQLNAGAPIDLTTPGSAPAVSPAPSRPNTNSP